VLFVVSSPLQLINAVEARDRFHTNEHTTLLFIFKKTIDIKQIQPILDQHWSQVHYFRWSKLTRLFYPLVLARLLKTLPKIARVYLGYPFNIRAHIANTCQEETWLLDDGTFTLWVNDQLAEIKSDLWKSRSIADHILGRRVSTQYLKQTTFFTCYNIVPKQGQPVVHNDFRCLKSRISADVPVSDEVLFIGTPVEKNLVENTDAFIALMHQVKSFYGSQQVVYAAHRYENVAERQRQLAELGINVVQFDTSLEVAFFNAESRPAEIASFTSSALSNLHQIYGFTSRSFRVPSSMTPLARRDVFKLLYEDIGRRDITITDLQESSK
jgi:hypothetical protein